MLELNEADKGGIGRAFMRGYNDAKQRASNVRTVLKQADAEEKKLRDDQKKVDMRAIVDEMTVFIQNYFQKFPKFDASNERFGKVEVKRIIENYPGKPTRLAAAKAFRDLAARTNQLRAGINKGFLKGGHIKRYQLEAAEKAARKQIRTRADPIPTLVQFVKSEAPFFIRLFKLNGQAKLNDQNFKDLITLKIKQTGEDRKQDAAQALNMLFAHTSASFETYADLIEQAIDQADSDEQNQRLADNGMRAGMRQRNAERQQQNSPQEDPPE